MNYLERGTDANNSHVKIVDRRGLKKLFTLMQKCGVFASLRGFTASKRGLVAKNDDSGVKSEKNGSQIRKNKPDAQTTLPLSECAPL